MKMTKTTLINEIHLSELFGILIECGAGQPIASSLFDVSGASRTIYYAESPYNWEYNKGKYGTGEFRSVSAESCGQIIKSIASNYSLTEKSSFHYFDENKVNFIMSTSFQVGEFNNISTHGWIALNIVGDSTIYYHISIHESLSREQYIKKIGEIGIEILHDKNRRILGNKYIDMILDHNFIPRNEDVLDNFLQCPDEFDTADFMLAYENGRFVRLEDVFRKSRHLLVMKGSFNPITNIHTQVFDCASQFIKFHAKEVNCVLNITVSNFDKATINKYDLMNRIFQLNKIGYTILINKKPMFLDSYNIIRNKFRGHIYFALGADIIPKLLMHPYNMLTLPIDKDLFNSNFDDMTTFLFVDRHGYPISFDHDHDKFIK